MPWAFIVAAVFAVAFGWIGPQPSRAQPAALPLSADQRQTLEDGLRALKESLATADAPRGGNLADAAIFAKGVEWALRHDGEFSADDVQQLERALRRGTERLAALAEGRCSWADRRGMLVLGYRSRVDGSHQPYGLVVPKHHDPGKATRLDVVLHGSSRPVGMSELRFMARFDQGDEPGADPPDAPFIELHPLGRVENCYRWSGETDVFEAIEDVCRRYRIDRDRIVLRGMSMGASGTWHLGLKHPDRFVALGPYCGYVDTHRFSETPIPGFIKVGPLPVHQELGLHMLDSVDYAANAGVVPAIACMGGEDVFFQAHVLMEEAMRREGLDMVNLISPGTGHVVDPVTHAEQMRRIAVHADRGLNHTPLEMRFVTWTVKYGRCHWLQVLGLDRHYARAEVAARVRGDSLEIAEPPNVSRFAVDFAVLPPAVETVRIGTTELAVGGSGSAPRGRVVFQRDRQVWSIAPTEAPGWAVKRPGLQGPIDDAFTAPFLCVRGTGTPWNRAVHDHAIGSLDRFAGEWHRYFRGDLPVKDDSSVTDEDLRSRNLILFGDPGSNALLARALPRLPLEWTPETLRLAGREYPSPAHMPALIVPSPLSSGVDRYLVVNSGHTFRGADLGAFNYLLVPRWGDWAVVDISAPGPVDEAHPERVVEAGFFNERWEAP
jgi:hypothetical protein